jgi:hypothetical protein
MNNKWSEIVGWYGVVAVVSAYLLNSFSLITPSNIIYPILNLTGAIGIAIDAFKQKNYQPVVLNIIWALVAVASLWITRN